jgi:hypothetical protein
MGEEAAKLEDLFTEKRVGEYTVREWSLGQIVELAPIFEQAKRMCVERKFTLDTLAADPLTLVTAITPLVPRVLAVTMRVDEAKVRELPGSAAVTLALTVVEMNLAYLKNLFGPLMAAILLELRSEGTGASSGPSST